jgi:hypothetical protein
VGEKKSDDQTFQAAWFRYDGSRTIALVDGDGESILACDFAEYPRARARLGPVIEQVLCDALNAMEASRSGSADSSAKLGASIKSIEELLKQFGKTTEQEIAEES